MSKNTSSTYKSNLWGLFILTSVIIVLLLGIAFCYSYIVKAEIKEEPSQTSLTATDIQELTAITEQITTNVGGSETYIRVKYSILVDNIQVKEEIDLLSAKVKSSILKVLFTKNKTDFQGSESIIKVEKEIQEELNKLLLKGKVVEVNTMELIIA